MVRQHATAKADLPTDGNNAHQSAPSADGGTATRNRGNSGTAGPNHGRRSSAAVWNIGGDGARRSGCAFRQWIVDSRPWRRHPPIGCEPGLSAEGAREHPPGGKSPDRQSRSGINPPGPDCDSVQRLHLARTGEPDTTFYARQSGCHYARAERGYAGSRSRPTFPC